MPNSRKSRSQSRRRRPRPSRKLPNPVQQQWVAPYTAIFKGIGFPDRLRMRMKYSEGQGFSASITPAAQVYRMNSLFDPDLTGVGHQPEFYDQLAAIYGIYCVVGATAILEVASLATVPTFFVACYMDQNNSTLSVENLIESKYAMHRILGYSTGSGVTRFSMPYMSTKQIMGTTNVESDANLYQTVGANPNDQWFLVVKATSTDGATNVTLNFRTTIIYDVVWKDLSPIVDS